MNRIYTTAMAVVALSVIVGAESAREMNMTYTGCVEAVNHGGSFFLTRVSDGGRKAMKDGMDKDHMTPNTLVLAGRDLKKHVGQTVTVTGLVSPGAMGTLRGDLKTLAVGSLKVVAKSCSKE
jgi:hypothetical protein